MLVPNVQVREKNIHDRILIFLTFVPSIDYYREAFITLEKMKSAGFIPDLATWNSILYASATVGDYEMAERTFQEMVNQRGTLPLLNNAFIIG